LPEYFRRRKTMGKNKDNHGIQQGALDHAPSQQGKKTHDRQAEIAHTPADVNAAGVSERRDVGEEIKRHDTKGHDRLFEDRQQHDEADRNSEKTRLARDIQRHHHESEDELTQRNVQSRAKRKN
jgi:hypothetical protein